MKMVDGDGEGNQQIHGRVDDHASLGTETSGKTVNCSEPASGDCISNAARRQMASLGIIKLV